jgi:CspA family cold shock protein
VSEAAKQQVVVRETGTVKWFNNSLNFGFICRNENSDDCVFVHYSQILSDGYRTLDQGESVEFEVIETPKGPQATSVKRLKQATTK